MPTISSAPGQIFVVSHAVTMGCPIVQGAEPFMFTQNAALEVLPDGVYTLEWTQADAAPIFQVRQQFRVKAGLLSVPSPEPIPTLSPWPLFLSAFLTCCVGVFYRRPVTRRSAAT